MLNDLLTQLAAKGPFSYVQFGGNDGVLADPLWPFLRDGGDRHVAAGHVFEPNPVYFERLVRNLGKFAQITCHNCAIGSAGGPAEQALYFIHPDDVTTHNLPRWTMGLCSFYDDKNTLGGVGSPQAAALYETIKPFIRKVDVPCLSLAEALEKIGVSGCDLLLSDTEGHDWEILRQWDVERFGRPAIIHAEIVCLNEAERSDMLAWFDTHRYHASIEGQNVTAQRID